MASFTDFLSPPDPRFPQPQTPAFNFQDAWYNANPDVAFQAWRMGQPGGGGTGLDPYGRFVSGQYGRLYNQYQAVLPQRGINYSFTDYLGEQGGGLRNQFQNLAPQQRGENPGQYAGRARWVL